MKSFVHRTQLGRIHVLLFNIAALAGGGAVLSLMSVDRPLVALVLTVTSAGFALLALCFRELTVEDRGDVLAVRYGPLPVFGTHIRYASMTAVEAGRSSFIDGCGIHYIPGRGWTYNLWGFECVVVHLGKKAVRIGTEDAINLRNFLQRRITTR